MKIAPILRALNATHRCTVRLIHTGQHYDQAMNAVFFQELGIPEPDINLEVGSGTNTEQTAQVMLRLEPALLADRPDVLLLVGDVNSTMAAALVGSKLLIPIAHVEAGLRSNDRTMPEEVNRLVTDRLSDLLFTTERQASDRLIGEGVSAERIYFVGNVMIDTLYSCLGQAEPHGKTISRHANGSAFADWALSGYGIVTLHRPSNVDDPTKLSELLDALAKISNQLPLIFPLHPRTRARIESAGLMPKLAAARILVTPPLGYLEMLGLTRGARLAITDSGGLQEETTALGVQCLTVRDNTERPITISEGTNTLVGSSPAALLIAARRALSSVTERGRMPELWDGKTAHRIASHLIEFAKRRKLADQASKSSSKRADSL